MCPGGVPVVPRWCPGGVPVGSWWCPGGVPVVSRWCPGGVPVVSRWCPGGVPVVSWWCPGGVPVVSRWCLGGVPVVPGSVCVFIVLSGLSFRSAVDPKRVRITKKQIQKTPTRIVFGIKSVNVIKCFCCGKLCQSNWNPKCMGMCVHVHVCAVRWESQALPGHNTRLSLHEITSGINL